MARVGLTSSLHKKRYQRQVGVLRKLYSGTVQSVILKNMVPYLVEVIKSNLCKDKGRVLHRFL
jgi:hypothetical protein